MDDLKLEPLRQLPLAVAALAKGAAPAKLMAVRGMAPLRPAELLIAIYQLSFDADASVKAAAESAPGSLPDKLLLSPLGEPLPPPVLHFFAERLPLARRGALEKILLNQVTADETFVQLARRMDEAPLEIIFQNEVRLLRCPALVEALYFNKHARMSSVSRALELCARNHVRPEGVPGFDELSAALLSDPNAAAPSLPDESFAAAVAAVDGPAPDQADGNLDDGTGAEAQKASKATGGIIKFGELKIFEKIRLATVGNQFCRQVLIRDTNRVVAMSVVRSPSISDMEIVAAAGSRSVCDDVIRYIANSRVHVKDYAVKQALVTNPKCPLGTSLRLLSFLHVDDLRALSRSRNVAGALSAAAKKLIQTREQR